jgi:hypothetical protein
MSDRKRPVSQTNVVEHRFVARFPDGSTKVGKWQTERQAADDSRAFAKQWLLTVKDSGLKGQIIRIEMQRKITETRVFLSSPSALATYHHVDVDYYGNVRGIS